MGQRISYSMALRKKSINGLNGYVRHPGGRHRPVPMLVAGGRQITSPARISTFSSPSHRVQPPPAAIPAKMRMGRGSSSNARAP
jgi:hypothetical protein